MNKELNRGLAVIGWREWVGLPELGVKRIKAKVDTGARSSSLHVFDLERFEQDDTTYVRFKINPAQRNTKIIVEAESPVLEFRSVKSSNGEISSRPVIRARVSLLNSAFDIDLTLANRDQMGFRMLLGREAFRNRFLVDAGNSYFGGRPKRKRKKNNR